MNHQDLENRMPGLVVILASIASLAWSTHACTVTWIGEGMSSNWNDAANWSSDPELPGPNDDVCHTNSDVIQLNIGSVGQPVVINSFTVDGQNGGGLEIQADRVLHVAGDFINTAADPADGYDVLVMSEGRLEVGEAQNSADLVNINVKLEAGSVMQKTELTVSGAIKYGEFDAEEDCLLTAGTAGAAQSILAGAWTLADGAEAIFEDQIRLDTDHPLTLTIRGGSFLQVISVPYTHGTFYDPTGSWDQAEHKIMFGEGANVMAFGFADPNVPTGLHFGEKTVIKPSGNTGTLTLDIYARLMHYMDFEHEVVSENWDTRRVDIISRAIHHSFYNADTRIEAISPNFLDLGLFPDVPVIFLDVPCHGTYRDLTFPGAETEEVQSSSLSDEYDNAWIDNVYVDLLLATGPFGETLQVRDVTVGENRLIQLYSTDGIEGVVRILFYGVRTIDESATIEYSDGLQLDQVITAACGTIYGDWDGDCLITNSEMGALQAAIQGGAGAYNPLYDYNCSGDLSTAVEGAAIFANYLAQPNCDCSHLSGAGSSVSSSLSSEGLANLAEWLTAGMTSSQLDEFISELVLAIAEFEQTAIASEMAELLLAVLAVQAQ